MKKNVAIIGLGFIGKTIIDAIIEKNLPFEIKAIYDVDNNKITEIQSILKNVRIMESLADFDDCDIVVECAVQQVVEEIFDKSIEIGNIFIPLSVGSFITSDSLYEKYQQLTNEEKNQIILVSGAIGGFDTISAIFDEGFDSALLMTTKPLAVFAHSSYVKDNEIVLNDDEPTMIFSGNAKEAAAAFPRSINVAARLALSSLGPKKTQVEVWADPSITKNIHQVKLVSKVGLYEFQFINEPSPKNPKTSWLAALSAIKTLENLN